MTERDAAARERGGGIVRTLGHSKVMTVLCGTAIFTRRHPLKSRLMHCSEFPICSQSASGHCGRGRVLLDEILSP
jgi:hypothetical protein